MNLEISDLSQYNFLGYKRLFQADEFTVWFFWKHGSSFSPVLGYLMGRGHHLLTSLAVVWISHQPHQASFKAIVCHLTIKKMHLQRHFSHRDGGLHFQTQCPGSVPCIPSTYRNASKTIFHLNFSTKVLLNYIRTPSHIQKGPAVTFKCSPITRALKGKICIFSSNGWFSNTTVMDELRPHEAILFNAQGEFRWPQECVQVF